MKKEKFTLQRQWREAVTYLKVSANYVYAAFFIFLASAILGMIFANQLSFLQEVLRGIIDQTANLNTIELIFLILQNNLQTALLGMLLGVIFGIFPIFNAIANGAILGYVLALTYNVAGIASWWRLLPHGIFELPAIFIALGLGIKLGFTFFQTPKIFTTLRDRLYHSANTFLMIVIPLLIIAAIIEGLLIGLLE